MHNSKRILVMASVLAVAALTGCGSGDGEGNGNAGVDRGTREGPPNIIVLMVDALRADHLASYGYDRETSPYLDELAARGVVFERAYAQASQTRLSVASLMTGLNPPSHHVREAATEPGPDGRILSDVLSDELDTLAERLRDAGYVTAGFVTNPHLVAGQGFDQGFDHYWYMEYKHCMADRLNDEVLNWLAQERDEPYFAYVHYMDVHMPYRPPSGYVYSSGENPLLRPFELNGPPAGPVDLPRISRTINLYDGQIKYWDDMLRTLVAGLPGGEALENTVVVVVSDHGDEFYENGGFGHGYTVYDGVVRVPLVVVGLEGQAAGTRRSDPARLTDLLPTICSLAGAPVDETLLEGSDLFAAGRSEGIPGLEIYAEAPYGKRPRSLRKDDRLLIYNETDAAWEYYDLKIDPFQQIDTWADHEDSLTDLRADLERLQEGRDLIAAPERAELDDKTVESLKSLGY